MKMVLLNNLKAIFNDIRKNGLMLFITKSQVLIIVWKLLTEFHDFFTFSNELNSIKRLSGKFSNKNVNNC